MGKPDASRQFRVTEREAGTGRMSFAAPALLEVDKNATDDAAAGGDCGMADVSEGASSSTDDGVIEVEPVIDDEACECGDERCDEAAEADETCGIEALGVAAETQGEKTKPSTVEPVVIKRAPAKTAAVLAREQQVEALGTIGNNQVMPAVEAIRNHPTFIDHMKRIARAERDREFCRHDMGHLLDVARIAYICALEHKMPFRKEVIYAAALLHDVGKAEQYEHGKPHEEAGMSVATKILQEVDGFSALEKTAIVAAVGQHRRYSENSSPLGRLLFQADKASRPCFACGARSACKWSKEQMNAGVKI